jgi:hypothetical protein
MVVINRSDKSEIASLSSSGLAGFYEAAIDDLIKTQGASFAGDLKRLPDDPRI